MKIQLRSCVYIPLTSPINNFQSTILMLIFKIDIIDHSRIKSSHHEYYKFCFDLIYILHGESENKRSYGHNQKITICLNVFSKIQISFCYDQAEKENTIKSKNKNEYVLRDKLGRFNVILSLVARYHVKKRITGITRINH